MSTNFFPPLFSSNLSPEKAGLLCSLAGEYGGRPGRCPHRGCGAAPRQDAWLEGKQLLLTVSIRRLAVLCEPAGSYSGPVRVHNI